MKKSKIIELDHGGGGYKSWEIVREIRRIMPVFGDWEQTEDDGAVISLGQEKLVFTTDAFIVDPIFFPGGDIGKIALCGTINDLAVMGARPLGVSLSLVMEEGFPLDHFRKIIRSIKIVSRAAGVPVVTGDTKVTQKGKIDKLEITTAGVGLAKKIIKNSGARPGDAVITSGDLGEHSVALLAHRFNYKTRIKSDSKHLNKELALVGKFLHACKDPTRGGLAANLVEIADKSRVKIILDEATLPYKKETISVCELLGIDAFTLAAEGRFIATATKNNALKALVILKRYNKEARIIGTVERGRGTYVKTELGGLRKIEMPQGKLIPRIC